MKHLLIGREYPPAPGGGIGTYAWNMSRLLAEHGEIVHVIAQQWQGAEKDVEEQYGGRLVLHRVPLQDWTALWGPKPSPALESQQARALFATSFYPQSFSWQAALLAERLIEQEGIEVIEAPEYEAPLYYFLLRRALGWGPKRCPPCIVHLHSPTEFIARHNDWDMVSPMVVTAKRLEDYCIAAADGLLCPSHYLTRQVEAHHKVAQGTIRVIPYPIGEIPVLKRDGDTWEHGPICYVGRFERRKGALEWLEAAVAVAHDYPTARFQFIGANALPPDRLSAADFVERKIPKDLKPRFRFHGQKKRASLPQFLAAARIGVVPSRWDNFPYTCVEAMASGLPVIASRAGGMAEMIEDGRTGWLAEKPGREGLVEALKRALETPPLKIAEMGRQASSDIRRLCDNKAIVERHLDFRSLMVQRGATRSLRLPANLPRAGRPLCPESGTRTPADRLAAGIAIVVSCSKESRFLDDCLRSLAWQLRKPAAVVIVDDRSTDRRALQALNKARSEGWTVIARGDEHAPAAKNLGIEAIRGAGSQPLGLAFVDADDQLQPSFVAICEAILERCPEIGLVSGWTDEGGMANGRQINPCPAFPYQWLSNDAAPLSVVRTEALREAGNFRHLKRPAYEHWDLVNAVMAAGWVAVTIPELLGTHWVRKDLSVAPPGSVEDASAYRELLERFPDLIAQDAEEIALLSGIRAARARRAAPYPEPKILPVLWLMLSHPWRNAAEIWWVLGQVIQKMRPRMALQRFKAMPRRLHAIIHSPHARIASRWVEPPQRHG